MALAGRFDHRLEESNAPAQPCEFFRTDGVMRRVAGTDVSLTEQFETALGELRIARPDRDQLGHQRLGLAAQKVQLVRLGAVERVSEQDGVEEPFGGLMEVEGRFIVVAARYEKPARG